MITQIKQSIRSLRRSPFLVFVSMPGLIIGLAASLFLIFYIQFESSFDEHFPNKQRVVRLYNRDLGDGDATIYPICLREAYTEVPKQIPEIEAATQIYPFGRNNVYFNGKQFNNQLVLNVDPEFFNVFGLNLTEGNRNEALKQKNSVVLSASLAKKLCDSNSCLGKVIKIGDYEFTVTGIIKDLPVNTHFHFDLLASMSTLNQDYFGGLEFFTYYLLKKNSDFNTVNNKISKAYNQILKNHFTGFMEHPESGIEPLSKLHMHTLAAFDLSEKVDVKGIYIMSVLALFILLIAIINHINLFVLYGEKRSSEIGIRKSLGAGNSELSVQFYFETTLFVSLAFILAYLTVAAFSPEIANRAHIGLSQFRFINPVTIGGSILLLVLIIALSGSYPAFYLSRLNVISAIKGNSGSVHRKKLLAVIAVLVQFTISIFLISVLIIIHSQFTYLKNIPLGFNDKNVVGVSGFDDKIRNKSKSVIEELKNLPFVESVGSSAHFMGGGCSGQMLYNYGESEEDGKDMNEYRVQAGFCKTMQLKLVAGRFFNGSSEDQSSIILNQTAVKTMGLDDPIGKSVVMFDDPMKIIGVVKDFYYNENAGEPIAPLALTSYTDFVNVFYLRIKGKLTGEKKQQIKTIFSHFDPDFRFSLFTLSDIYKSKFGKEDRLLSFLLYGTLIAILLSFGGMFALSFFNVERRTKEIGIRKVLGSTSTEVLIKLLKDILIWVLWSMLPAFLITYLIMKNWLTNFTNKIDITPVYFLLSGIIAIAIATLAISIQGIKAARQNPVESLRYE